ncbi:MAG TPA: EamA family transporter [Candidatus Methylacidiphilales bacterium]|jgi:undecaprenyl phosphate-alpha-L-ara4N flippase subunit ArnE|nr:EamA family transporter [Candidatus Methylacidiphilales bacterium]
MSLLAWLLIIVSQLALVAGQIFLKRAMSRREHGGEKARGWVAMLLIGVATMTVWFLLWLGVMPHLELSKQMPLEGISPLLIVLGAAAFLRERLNWRGWAGVGLTCVGVFLVSAS